MLHTSLWRRSRSVLASGVKFVNCVLSGPIMCHLCLAWVAFSSFMSPTSFGNLHEQPYGPDSGEVLEINYDLADDNGNTNGRGGTITAFYGRSLTELVNELAHRLGNGIDFQNITLFVRAGNLGQLTPLLTDLPHRDDPIDIVVFIVGTPGHNELRFPDLNAE